MSPKDLHWRVVNNQMVEKWAKCDLLCFVGINWKRTVLILKDVQDLILSDHGPETQT